MSNNTQKPDIEEYLPPFEDDLYPEQETKRNFRLGVLNGILYIFADTLLDPTLVLVSYVSHLTQSPLLLGAIVPIRDGSWSLPQLWVSGAIQNKPYKLGWYKTMSYVRIVAWAIMVSSIVFVSVPEWRLAAFFGTFIIASLASGLSGLPFLEVVSKTIPPERRGELFAYRLGLGGLLGIGASLLVRWLIDPAGPVEFPINFSILSVSFFVIASMSLLIFNGIHELPDIITRPKVNFWQQIKRAHHIAATNSNYRYFLVTVSLLLVASSSTPFFAVYVQQLGGNKGWIGYYLGILMISNLLANYVFGRLSRKVDNQKVMVLATSAGFIMTLIMLVLSILQRSISFSPLWLSAWLLPVFALAGIRSTGITISTNSLLLNIAPQSDRTLVIGFTQTIMGVVLLMTGLSGLFLKIFGYTALFSLALLAHLAALYFGRKTTDTVTKTKLI